MKPKSLKTLLFYLATFFLISFLFFSWQPFKAKIIAYALKSYCQKQWDLSVSTSGIHQVGNQWIIDNPQFSGLIQGNADQISIECSWKILSRKLHLDISIVNPKGSLQNLPDLSSTSVSTMEFATPRWEWLKISGKIDVNKGILRLESQETEFGMHGEWKTDGSGKYTLVMHSPGNSNNQCVFELLSSKQGHSMHIDMHNVDCSAAMTPLQLFGPLKDWAFIEGRLHGHLLVNLPHSGMPEATGNLIAEQLTAFHANNQLHAIIPALSLTFSDSPGFWGKAALFQASFFGLQDADDAHWMIHNISGELLLSSLGETNILLEAIYNDGVKSQPIKLTGKTDWNLNDWEADLTLPSEKEPFSAHLACSSTGPEAFALQAQINADQQFPLVAEAIAISNDTGMSIQGILSLLHSKDPLRIPFGINFVPSKNSQQLLWWQRALASLGFEFTQGWFHATDIPLNTYFAPFILKHNWQAEGLASLDATFEPNSLVIAYDLLQPALQNDRYKLHSEEIVSGIHYFDFASHAHGGFLPLDNAVLLDKTHQVNFTDTLAHVFVDEHHCHVLGIEAFNNGIYCAGDMVVDYSDPLSIEIDIHAHHLNGTIPQFQEVLKSLAPQSCLPRCFMDGNISLREEGSQLHVTLLPNDTLITGSVHGTLTDGALIKQGSNASLRDVGFNFDITVNDPQFLVSDIQGTLLIGSPERAEEYILAGDRIQYSNGHADFDLWVGDRSRDILRLVGKTKTQANQTEFVLDRELSHFGDVHPNQFQLVLKDWSAIEHVHLQFNFQLSTMLQDLQKFSRTGLFFLNRHFLQDLNRLKRAEGLFDVDLNYDNQTALLNYAITGKDFAIGKYQFKEGNLNGKLQDNVWVIDQLQLDNLSLAAEFQPIDNFLKFKFLGIRAGKSLLLGMDGALSLQMNTFNGKINLLELQLADLSEWPALHQILKECDPSGTMRAAGELHAAWTPNKPEWHVDTHLYASLHECQVLGTQLNNAINIPLQLNLKGDPGELSLKTEWRYQGLPLWVNFETKLPSMLGGKVFLRDHPNASPLVIEWVRDSQSQSLLIPTISGSISGIGVQLIGQRSPEGQSQFTGDLNIDLAQTLSFPPEIFTTLSQNAAKGYFSLSGTWTSSPGAIFNIQNFSGKLKGTHCSYQGYDCQSLTSDVLLDSEQITLQNVFIQDNAGMLTSKEISLHQNDASQWLMAIPELIVTDLHPSTLAKNGSDSASDFMIKRLEINDISANLPDIASLKGKGIAQCENPPKVNAAYRWLQIPQDLLEQQGLDLSVLTPESGQVFFEIADQKITLTKFKDMYSAGKLSKFILSKAQPSYIDFDGNLHLHVRMKQYNLLFKLAELFTISVEGHWQHPVYSLLKDEG